jgi:AbrB family looped-hinge helix DNA binding protein
MAHATVSAKFQVVIPTEIRREVPIRKGQRLQVVAKGDVISLVPERPLAVFRGLLKGASTAGVREKRDRR